MWRVWFFLWGGVGGGGRGAGGGGGAGAGVLGAGDGGDILLDSTATAPGDILLDSTATAPNTVTMARMTMEIPATVMGKATDLATAMQANTAPPLDRG